VLVLLEILNLVFPHYFGEACTKQLTTEQVKRIFGKYDLKFGDMSRLQSRMQTWRCTAEAVDMSAWRVDDIIRVVDGEQPAQIEQSSSVAEVVKREDENVIASEAVWDDAADGLAGNGHGSYIIGDGDWVAVDREEYGRRLRHYVESGTTGHMLLAIDSLGISVNSFRHWLRSGQVPSEWGGANFSPKEDELLAQRTTRAALLARMLLRLSAALRRLPTLLTQASQSKSWRFSLISAPISENGLDTKTGLILEALLWAADGIENLARVGTSSQSTSRLAAPTQEAADRVAAFVDAGFLVAGEIETESWPRLSNDPNSATVDVAELLHLVGALAAELGTPAAAVASMVVDVHLGLLRVDNVTARLESQCALFAAEQQNSGPCLGATQAAVGESVSQHVDRLRAGYFTKLSAGQIATFQDSHKWFIQCRETYWSAARQEWSVATIRPHVWRAIFEECISHAVEQYWNEFFRCKRGLQHKDSVAHKPRSSGNTRSLNHLWKLDGAKLEGLKGDATWKHVVDHAHDASVEWMQRPRQMAAFPRGPRGQMFAQPKLLRAHVQTSGGAYVTWRTKQCIWDLHCRHPDHWDANSISQEFGLKLEQVEGYLEFFRVRPCVPCSLVVAEMRSSQLAPTFSGYYGYGQTRPYYKARELQQQYDLMEPSQMHA